MISVIVPSYKNPKGLDLCIKSFLDTSNQSTNQLICVIDGYPELYKDLIQKYTDNPMVGFSINEDNQGMPFSINMGAYLAENNRLLIINDDNVFCRNWDNVLIKYNDEKIVVSVNQIERGPSIFNFIQHDFGDIDHFRYEDFLDTAFESPTIISEDGGIFPFSISKKIFVASGGFDLIYPSPFICDWDFFLKLELLGLKFVRTREINFYHFGSLSTKNSVDIDDALMFKNSENIAAEIFAMKWGFSPTINLKTNSHKPSTNYIRGINYYDS